MYLLLKIVSVLNVTDECKRGTTARIKEYVHCSSNGLNLSVVKAMSVPQAGDMMGRLPETH